MSEYHHSSDEEQDYGSDVEGGFVGALKKRWKKGNEQGVWKGLGINWLVCGLFEIVKAILHWTGLTFYHGILLAFLVVILILEVHNFKTLDHIKCQQDTNTDLIRKGFGI